MRLFNRYVSTRSLTVFGGELLLIFGSVALAAALQGGPVNENLWKIVLVTVVCQLCLYYNDFYDLTLVHSNRELIVRLLQAVGAASIVLAALYFTVPALMMSRPPSCRMPGASSGTRFTSTTTPAEIVRSRRRMMRSVPPASGRAAGPCATSSPMASFRSPGR